MTGLIQVETVSVRKIRNAMLPLVNGQEINLLAAYREMKGVQLFSVKYDSDGAFKALYVSFGLSHKANFCIFRNGKVAIFGNWPIEKESATLTFLWEFFLQQCLV